MTHFNNILCVFIKKDYLKDYDKNRGSLFIYFCTLTIIALKINLKDLFRWSRALISLSY